MDAESGDHAETMTLTELMNQLESVHVAAEVQVESARDLLVDDAVLVALHEESERRGEAYQVDTVVVTVETGLGDKQRVETACVGTQSAHRLVFRPVDEHLPALERPRLQLNCVDAMGA